MRLPASADKGRFKKSLSMSGEVGSLAGDRVVSHERSRPADLPQRQDFRPPHAGSYPSDYRGCVSWHALLASHHRRRESVTVDGAFERGNQLLLRLVSSHAADLGFEGGRSLAIVGATTRSHSTEHNAQIVCGHFGDDRLRESSGVRNRDDPSRSRKPQFGLRSRRLRSNAWLLGAVANPSRLYGP
jgi:hypothetical protein